MEHNHFDGPGATLLSILSAMFAWVTLQEGQIILTMVASLTAIVTGILASRYWYIQTKKMKKK